MYVKLFARVTESSLMEEPVETRYVFVMMLALADPEGYVEGTDTALARRINVPLDDFKAAIQRLMQPDPVSNSPEQEGRRILPSDSFAGYRITNFVAYRDTKDQADRREYMRDYMRKRRAESQEKPAPKIDGNMEHVNTPLTPVNSCKLQLTQEEVDVEEDEEVKADAMLGADASAPNVKVKPSKSKKPKLTDEAFLSQLAADPAYDWINISQEHAKMVRWCDVHGKMPTRRRFISWLNRVDRPMTAKPVVDAARPQTAYEIRVKLDAIASRLKALADAGTHYADGFRYASDQDRQEAKRLKAKKVELEKLLTA